VGDAAGEMGDALPIVPLGAGRTAVQVAAGGSHTCVILDDGTLKCFGHGAQGQLDEGMAESAQQQLRVRIQANGVEVEIEGGYTPTSRRNILGESYLWDR
jgi:alpha-tubulin suppressor-like RCC1 family protein